MSKLSACGMVAVVAVTACEPSDAPAEVATWGLDDATVVFERRDSAGSGLFGLDRRTGDQTRLTPAASRNWSGRVSPDGERLLFISSRDGDYEVYVSGVDGLEPDNLTQHPDYDVVGAWSPDGARVAFMSTRGFELGGEAGPFPGHVYVVDADAGGLRQVTLEPLTSSLGPTDWSPDGRWLTIAREMDGQADIFLLDVETGEEHRVTSDPSSEYGASFSRDGLHLAFHAEDGSASRIVVSDLDGSNRRVVTPPGEVGYSPRWSPDDAWLLYTRLGEGPSEQYDAVAVRVGDGVIIPIASTPADERAADWWPAMR
ncbi:MAG: hypothetical protein HKN72_16310 [Gemmatimonadetes bacterium]|nr:hypothetical protein [Gemmatimonadota bacterium]